MVVVDHEEASEEIGQVLVFLSEVVDEVDVVNIVLKGAVVAEGINGAEKH